jgi:acetyl-CoA carboxylase biotin carboxyl carrier protein
MDLEQIRELLKLVAESGVTEVEIEDEEFRIVIRTSHAESTARVISQPAATQVLADATAPPPFVDLNHTPEAEVPTSTGRILRAPIVGTYYASPSPDAEPFVQVGDVVKPGDVLCIIEAMKLMNEIEAEVGGTVKEILVENAQPVQYDEPLFVVEP